MAVHDYDITAAEVADFIGQLNAIGASQSPDATAVASWITQYCSRVNQRYRAKGYTPSNFTSTATVEVDLERYHSTRNIIIKRVASDWHAANRNGDTTLAARYYEEWRTFLEELHDDAPNQMGGTSGATGFETNITSTNLRDDSTRVFTVRSDSTATRRAGLYK